MYRVESVDRFLRYKGQLGRYACAGGTRVNVAQGLTHNRSRGYAATTKQKKSHKVNKYKLNYSMFVFLHRCDE